MKIRFIIWLFFLASFLRVQAQEKFSAYVNLNTEPTDKIDFNETNIGLSFSKKVNTKNSITNTIEYSNLKVNYELTSSEPIENLDQFQQIKNTFEYSKEIANETILDFSIIPTVNFQQHLSFSDFSLLGSFELRRQLNSKVSFSIGAGRTTVFGNPKFMPVASLNYKADDKTNLLIGFPDSGISYSNNIRNKFILSNSFNGNFYNLENQNILDNNASKVILSQMTTSFKYERNVDKNWFLNFKAGYDFDKKYELRDDENHTIYDFKTGNGYVLGIGIKYKQ